MRVFFLGFGAPKRVVFPFGSPFKIMKILPMMVEQCGLGWRMEEFYMGSGQCHHGPRSPVKTRQEPNPQHLHIPGPVPKLKHLPCSQKGVFLMVPLLVGFITHLFWSQQKRHSQISFDGLSQSLARRVFGLSELQGPDGSVSSWHKLFRSWHKAWGQVDCVATCRIARK